ncbi:MAG TPA: response regulator [Pyrinomonadaceae bacterium]|jgi:CheY-like chemotaxis protein
MKFIKPPILCVEDDKDNLEVMKYLFESEDFQVTACDNLDDCLEEVKKNQFSAIVLDYYMGSQNSLEVCEEIRSHSCKTPIIFYSGEARKSEIQKAMEHCADAFLVKPMDFSKLTETVNKLIQEKQTA